jgi:hypothetical protein
MLDNICPPALIYLAFSLTQIIIDTFKGLYNTAFLKFIVMITITFLLNALCQGGMSIISWIIVFIPFIFMTVIVTILLYVFGLDAATGTLKFKCTNPTTTSNSNSNLIYSSTPNTTTNTTTTSTTNTTSPYVSSMSVSVSSDPQYQ